MDRADRWSARRGVLVLVWIGWMSLWASSASAQSLRNELGKRLQRFEKSWQSADEVTRAKSREPMQAAVSSFFSLRLAAAARQLDEAWYTVRAEGEPSATERWGVSHQLSATPLFGDVQDETLTVTLRPLYEVPAPNVTKLQVRLQLQDGGGRSVAEATIGWAEATKPHAWSIGSAGAGDFTLTVELLDGAARREVARTVVSRAERLRERLATLAAAQEGRTEIASPTILATMKGQLTLLQALAESKSQETDFPAERLLRSCEETSAAPRGKSLAERARREDVWLTLSQGTGQTPVRVRAPAKSAGPLPVLFLFHGAGGSENMFFETCGAGRAVSLGLDRGWLVVAPRQSLLGPALDVEQMLAELGQFFPVDRRRVMLVGHSMGAQQVTRQASRRPELAAAAVALGGGGSAPSGDAARKIPWFIGAGQFDFGKSGAQALARRLKESGAAAEYREYEGVEHMVIVQAALDDVFRFLDASLISRSRVGS